MHKTLSLFLSATFAILAPTAASADPVERYFELQEVIEQINDPDPLMRIALLEEILAQDDATKVQLAIRAAMTIDDPNVRSLALRTHFASYPNFVITADYPDEYTQLLDAGDENAREDWADDHSYLMRMMEYLGGQFLIEVKSASPGGDTFGVHALNNLSAPSDSAQGTGNIRGALITLSTNVKTGTLNTNPRCTFEFSDYEGFTVRGTGSCDMSYSAGFPVTLHLFEPVQTGTE